MSEDDNSRELLGHITISDGRQIAVRMPIMLDVFNNPQKPPLQLMIEAGTGLTWDEFLRLPIIDGNAILLLMDAAIESFKNWQGHRH